MALPKVGRVVAPNTAESGKEEEERDSLGTQLCRMEREILSIHPHQIKSRCAEESGLSLMLVSLIKCCHMKYREPN